MSESFGHFHMFVIYHIKGANHPIYTVLRVRVMVFNATFNNISVMFLAVSLIDGGNHRPAASHWQTLSHNVV
jgi:hypothetical protein